MPRCFRWAIGAMVTPVTPVTPHTTQFLGSYHFARQELHQYWHDNLCNAMYVI